MKRNLSIYAGFAILLSSLSACASSGGKITLKIGFWPNSTDTKDVAMYEEWKKAFEKDNPEYVIKGVPYTYSLETIAQKALSNSLPDVWQTWFTEPPTLVANNYIRPITDILKENGWIDKMDKEMKAQLTIGNELYGIPRDGYGLGLIINKRLIGDNTDFFLNKKDESGKIIEGEYSIYKEDGSPAYPTTFAQIKEIAEEINDNSGESVKGILILSDNKEGGWQFSNMAWNFGAEHLVNKDSNGKWVSNLADPKAVEALSWIHSLRQEGLLLKDTTKVYNDWTSVISSQVAMAIVGNDVIQNAAVVGKMDMKDLAFVPMPTGDGTHHYSLYGGTPYVFTKGVSDEKVKGILKFFDYIGRSPSTSEANLSAIKKGYEVAKLKNQPILPTIRPWINEDFVKEAKKLENEYLSVNIEDFSPFYDSISANKHGEEPIEPQTMYGFLDTAIKGVIGSSYATANPTALLTTANSKFQNYLDSKVNK